MKQINLTIIAFVLTCACYSQNWVYSFDEAKNMAQKNNKLLLVDFWANWCGPCRELDAEVWSKEEVKTAMANFNCVKVDVDIYSEVANSYMIKAIPAIIVMDCHGNIVEVLNGVSNHSSMFKALASFPKDVSGLTRAMYLMEQETLSFENCLEADRLLKEEIKNTEGGYRRYVVNQDTKLLKKASKVCGKKDALLLEKIELLALYTSVLNNQNKKVIKQLVDKKGLDKLDETNKKLAFKILAMAYQNEGMKEESAKYSMQ
ncbi:thioredoxin family protein [Carboxylicivirga sp. A043]|uniref:thioredoxin family protein n=1 Tax=Carboxylicivirga litoralis TaxID=2816963 RepID=UPI0021CB334A|nr:thioredoxin family protein [Carboxylicivirga sp. A043]MCU4156636.1 thioredoxin family protein [Carboxylicivirga sp. A043]